LKKTSKIIKSSHQPNTTMSQPLAVWAMLAD